jgi:hypothetical protein
MRYAPKCLQDRRRRYYIVVNLGYGDAGKGSGRPDVIAADVLIVTCWGMASR